MNISKYLEPNSIMETIRIFNSRNERKNTRKCRKQQKEGTTGRRERGSASGNDDQESGRHAVTPGRETEK